MTSCDDDASDTGSISGMIPRCTLHTHVFGAAIERLGNRGRVTFYGLSNFGAPLTEFFALGLAVTLNREDPLF